MRDLLSGNGSDPAERARQAMKAPAVKRFYAGVDVAPAEGGHAVLLDGRMARTPGRAPLVLPTAAAARLVAEEFAAQGETIEPSTMPVMRLVNTAIDGVAADPQAVFEDILRYSGSDLVCYRAGSPDRLVAMQAAAWDPITDWADLALGARFALAEGMVHVAQPREAVAAFSAHLAAHADPFRLAAIHSMTSLTGSALLALAVASFAIPAMEAWAAAHVDESYNQSIWGLDEEAARRHAFRTAEFMAAVALVSALV